MNAMVKANAAYENLNGDGGKKMVTLEQSQFLFLSEELSSPDKQD